MSKRNLLTLSVLLGIMILAFAACKKEDITLNSGNQLRYLFLHLQSTPQSFTVNAGTSQTIQGDKGTILKFNPGSFKDAQGNTISTGTINLELIEMYRAGDMIANRVTTTTQNQKRLQSGGCVKIVAKMNGREVFTNGYSIAFKQPAYASTPMSLFIGAESIDSTGTRVQWIDDPFSAQPETIKISSQFYYLFDTCTSFNWINCDHFYTAPDPKTDIKIVMPDNSYTIGNTQAYIAFPAINSVCGADSYDAATHSFTLGNINYQVPVGAVVHIVVLTAKDGGYLMNIQKNVTVTPGMSINVAPSATSITDVQAALNSL